MPSKFAVKIDLWRLLAVLVCSWGSSRQILAQRRRVECPTTRNTCSKRPSTARPRRHSRRSSSGPGAKQIDAWVKQYRDHAEFGYIFRENARDVLNKQNPESVKKTLAYLASLVV